MDDGNTRKLSILKRLYFPYIPLDFCIHNVLSSTREEYPLRPYGSPEKLERRRLRAMMLLKQGLTPVEVARRLDVDRRSVRRWRASYERSGATALAARRGSRGPRKLDPRQQLFLEAVLRQGARLRGYPTDLWTCFRVRKLISKLMGVRYHVDHIGRLLRSMGWRYQKPERNKVAIGWVNGESKR